MISVLGWDGAPLREPARARLAAATLVCGGERHLAAVDIPAGAPTVVMGDVGTAVRALVEHDGDAVVVASGDPGLFGIVRRLRAAGLAPEVHPAVSSVALAFARAGLSWDDAVLTSAHGRDLKHAVAACRAHPKVAVLTAPAAGPAELGAALSEVPRRLFVAEDLGTERERCRWVTPEEAGRTAGWSPLNVVLAVEERRAEPGCQGWLAGREQPAGWALPEEAFEHRDGMVTKYEVRALALARLGPRLGELVWDVGAGSGSVGVECARLGAAVVAVEQGPVAHLTANARGHGVEVQVVQGQAPGVLAGLPDPDAVFVGGGGADVGAIVAACVARGPRVVVVALATLDRVTEVRAAFAPYAVDGVQLSSARLRDLGGATGLAATNPVLLLWGTRPPAQPPAPRPAGWLPAPTSTGL